MQTCATDIRVDVCPEHGPRRTVPVKTCKRRFCPVCERRQAMKRAHNLKRGVEQVLRENPGAKLALVTLTRRNVERAAGMVDMLLMPWRALRQGRARKKRVWGQLIGGYWGFETTEKGRGWHPHIHALSIVPANWGAEELDMLCREWIERVGPDAERQAQQARFADLGAVTEVCKYLGKSADLSPEQLREVEEELVGRHVRGTFGALRGLKLDAEPEDDSTVCDICGGPLEMELHAWDFSMRRYVRKVASIALQRRKPEHADTG